MISILIYLVGIGFWLYSGNIDGMIVFGILALLVSVNIIGGQFIEFVDCLFGDDEEEDGDF